MAVTQRWAADEASERVRDALGSRVGSVEVNLGDVVVRCERDQLPEVVRVLRDEGGFTFFSFLSAVDWSEYTVEEGEPTRELEVLVHLYAPDHAAHVTVRVPVSFADPTCPTISGLFLGALWHEREMWDMYGIGFTGHPNLVRLYLPEDFDGHPGLKAFKLPSRTLVKEWPGAKDPDEAAAGGR